MKELLVDLRDTRFILYDMLEIENLCRFEKFIDHSRESFEMVIKAAEKLATKEFAPSNSDGDTTGCIWHEGVVRVPPSFTDPSGNIATAAGSPCPRTTRSEDKVSH